MDIFSAFFQTVRLLLSSPRRAYEQVPLTSNIGRPFAFGLIVSLIGTWAGIFWQLVLGEWWKSFLPGDTESVDTMLQIGLGLSAPLWVPIVIILSVAFQHLCLFVVGGARSGFSGTMRAANYSWAPALLALIPVCGQFVGGLWCLALNIIGLSVVHRITLGRAALAVFLPAVLCCILGVLMAALFGAAIFNAIGKAG
ncbi:MAG TPA: YIP1 family protein [Candidatus Limnocylindrales bacterium]|nr:YIP1 family protein [Candidatus Limnocylindrales bacterium]